MTGIVSSMADNLVLGGYKVVSAGVGALISFVLGSACTAMMVNYARRHRLCTTKTRCPASGSSPAALLSRSGCTDVGYKKTLCFADSDVSVFDYGRVKSRDYQDMPI
jgi:hypothetical protein